MREKLDIKLLSYVNIILKKRKTRRKEEDDEKNFGSFSPKAIILNRFYVEHVVVGFLLITLVVLRLVDTTVGIEAVQY